MLVNLLQAFRNSVNCTARSSVQSTLFLKAWSEPTCRWALSLFFIVSALRAYKQLRVPLAWRGGTKKGAMVQAGRVSPLVPVQSRTGTNGGIGPSSWAPGAGRTTWAIGPGSSGPFGPGWWDEPGPMGLGPGRPPLAQVGGTNRDQRQPIMVRPSWYHANFQLSTIPEFIWNALM